MSKGKVSLIPGSSIVFICCLGGAFPALAATPAPKIVAPAHAVEPVHVSPLDLRPPLASEFMTLKTATVEPHDVGKEEVQRGFRMNVGNPHAPATEGGEALVRRIRHEGIPVARLWESHSALVSLGLGPRLKPGIWLIQKTR